MCAGEIGIGAHIEVVALLIIEYGIEDGSRHAADRSGWESGIPVGVVRRFGLEMAVGDASQGEIAYGKDDGRAGLQQHAFAQAIDI